MIPDPGSLRASSPFGVYSLTANIRRNRDEIDPSLYEIIAAATENFKMNLPSVSTSKVGKIIIDPLTCIFRVLKCLLMVLLQSFVMLWHFRTKRLKRQ